MTDLWDVSQGNLVTDHSGVLSISDVTNMFGAITPTVEPGSTILGDHPQGFVHYVEWMTPQPIRLESFLLDAGHDGGGRDANYRGFSRFALFAENIKIFEFFPANPYGDSVAPANAILEAPEYSHILMLVEVPSTMAQHFRAEFDQFGSISDALGPRILELDGFGTVVPEPAALSLSLVGVAIGLLFARTRRR